jgi:hypothetical protein
MLESLAQAPHIGSSIDTMDGRGDKGIIGGMGVTIKIDSVISEDGQVFGPNESSYDTEIENRKLAATQLAKQIRNAMAKGEDVNVMFERILETKVSMNNSMGKWTNMYASSMKNKSAASFQSRLHTLENLPEPPKFVRK